MGLYNAYKKPKSLYGKVDTAHVEQNISANCSRGAKEPHERLDSFRNNVHGVCAWRRCYCNLPAADRDRRLTEMFHDEYVAQMATRCNDSTSFKMKFGFMGQDIISYQHVFEFAFNTPIFVFSLKGILYYLIFPGRLPTGLHATHGSQTRGDPTVPWQRIVRSA